jgi:hypothetical protein
MYGSSALAAATRRRSGPAVWLTSASSAPATLAQTSPLPAAWQAAQFQVFARGRTNSWPRSERQRIDGPAQANDNFTNGTIDTRPEAESNLRVLGRAVAAHLGMSRADIDTLHPYDARVLPGDAEIRQIAESFGSRVQGFGLRAGLLAADVERFGFLNGVLSDGFMDRGLRRDVRFSEVLVPRHC